MGDLLEVAAEDGVVLLAAFSAGDRKAAGVASVLREAPHAALLVEQPPFEVLPVIGLISVFGQYRAVVGPVRPVLTLAAIFSGFAGLTAAAVVVVVVESDFEEELGIVVDFAGELEA